MKRALALVSTLVALVGATSGRAAEIEVEFTDSNGEGFFDAGFMVFAPGNPSMTRGGQRQNVVRAAADYWERVLVSDVSIEVTMSMDAMAPCSASGGILGSAGPTVAIRNFPSAPLTDMEYTIAQANSLAGFDLHGDVDIEARFNSKVDGDASCFTSLEWWYGIGTPAPAGKVDFYRVVLHELGHGLGILSMVDLQSGARLFGYDDVYMRRLEDHSTGKSWPQMTDAERAASAKDTGDLHWTGPNAVALAALVTNGLGSGGHPPMYAPATLAPGSSVSHWTTTISPNEFMEPFAENDGLDYLTLGLMRDLGWRVAMIFEDGFESEDTLAWQSTP